MMHGPIHIKYIQVHLGVK